ncbi:FadR/GntR family transcriptional regulator [Undibacterium luofuense]|uniref:FadR/GntR family transcriptional regulator n=1 Tax=Undibacterium luofuense TaxID=2828733 RepID=UPI0030EF3A7E
MATKIPAYKLAQGEIKQYIEKNNLREGDALPPEGKLAEELGISRPSLREAVKALESLGIIESRHGEGIYVKPFTFDSILENLPYSMITNDSQISDLLYVRTYLEVGALSSVVKNIQPENILKLRRLAEKMLEKARQNETFADEDREFHAEMYRCLDNRFLLALIDLFWNIFNNMLKQSGPANTDPWAAEATANDHLSIVNMLETKDEAGLLKAHLGHFESIFKRYPKGVA